MADTKNLTNSNTTNVKVKHPVRNGCPMLDFYSNTTNVKVKRRGSQQRQLDRCIQIQPMLRLNTVRNTGNQKRSKIQIQPMLRLNLQYFVF